MSQANDPKTAHGETPEATRAAEKKHVERQLDHGLDETFPASDPVSINPGTDEADAPVKRSPARPG
jgi:hypothetical protein